MYERGNAKGESFFSVIPLHLVLCVHFVMTMNERTHNNVGRSDLCPQYHMQNYVIMFAFMFSICTAKMCVCVCVVAAVAIAIVFHLYSFGSCVLYASSSFRHTHLGFSFSFSYPVRCFFRIRHHLNQSKAKELCMNDSCTCVHTHPHIRTKLAMNQISIIISTKLHLIFKHFAHSNTTIKIFTLLLIINQSKTRHL